MTNNRVSIIFGLLTVLYAWHTAVPYVGVNMPAAVNALVLAMLVIFMLSDRGFHFGKAFKLIIPLCLLSLLEFVSIPISQLPAHIYGLLQRMVFPIMALYLMQNAPQRDKRRIFLFVLVGYAVTCVTTYLGCLAYPGASRQMATGMSEELESFNMYRQLNIGSFSFVYTVVLLLPLILYVIRNRKSPIILAVLFGIVSVIAIMETEYTTALLMMLSVLLLLFLPKDFTYNDFKRKLLLFIIIAAVAWLILPMLLDIIIPYIDSNVMSSRITELSSDLKGETASVGEGDVESRKEMFMVSIRGFLSSPIWGTFNKAGGHSFLLDTLSKYGLIGLGLLILMYKRAYTLFIKPYKSQSYYGYVLYVYIMTLILAVLNPKDNLLVLTFLIPLFSETYANESNEISI